MAVKEENVSKIRRLSGVLEAVEKTALSFQVGGNVKDVSVDLGDIVLDDQVLATLNPEPFELKVKAAEAALEQAQAHLQKTAEKEKSVKALWQQQYASKSSYDTAYAAYLSALGEVGVRQSELDLAKRDLRLTTLKAPFNGTIASKNIEPFVEVNAGQPVFFLQNDSGIEVKILLPENLRPYVAFDQEIEVRFPALKNRSSHGRITEIATRAESANSYSMTINLHKKDPDMFAGMTAEAAIPLVREKKPGFLIPINAIAGGQKINGHETGYVFVYEKESQSVIKTPIKIREIFDNEAEVIHGLKSNDIIATAGVHHLIDGQKVRLMEKD